MKKAIVMKKSGGIVECEYDEASILNIMYNLQERRIVNLGKKSFACDEIEQIEWID